MWATVSCVLWEAIWSQWLAPSIVLINISALWRKARRQRLIGGQVFLKFPMRIYIPTIQKWKKKVKSKSWSSKQRKKLDAVSKPLEVKCGADLSDQRVGNKIQPELQPCVHNRAGSSFSGTFLLVVPDATHQEPAYKTTDKGMLSISFLKTNFYDPSGIWSRLRRRL